jgi:hypothetical protein
MNDEIIQGIFDFNTGNQNGYENFLREQEAKEKRIREIWGLPVGRTVSLTLIGVPGRFEGKLKVAEQPKLFQRNEPLHLKIGKTGFFHHEIESCNTIG